jgi:hypothetical protein
VVLGGRPDHRRPADVDLLDQVVEGDAGPFGRRGERIEVDDDQLERVDGGRGELLAVGHDAAIGQDPGVDRGWSVLTRRRASPGSP